MNRRVYIVCAPRRYVFLCTAFLIHLPVLICIRGDANVECARSTERLLLLGKTKRAYFGRLSNYITILTQELYISAKICKTAVPVREISSAAGDEANFTRVFQKNHLVTVHKVYLTRIMFDRNTRFLSRKPYELRINYFTFSIVVRNLIKLLSRCDNSYIHFF